MKTYCGLTGKQMDRVLTKMCEIEDRIDLSNDEQDAFDISIQCVTDIMNKMKDGEQIEFEEV